MDLLLERYGSLKEVGDMPFKKGFKLVTKARTEKDKNKWFKIWLVRQPNNGENIIPFDKWYDSLLEQSEEAKEITNKSTDLILAEIEEIRERAVNNANI